MEGFISIPATEVIRLTEKAIDAVYDARVVLLEEEIASGLKVPRERTLWDVLTRESVSFPLREEVISKLKINGRYFGSLYNIIMESNSGLLQQLKEIKKAAKLVSNREVLLGIKIAAHLHQYKEK